MNKPYLILLVLLLRAGISEAQYCPNDYYQAESSYHVYQSEFHSIMLYQNILFAEQGWDNKLVGNDILLQFMYTGREYTHQSFPFCYRLKITSKAWEWGLVELGTNPKLHKYLIKDPHIYHGYYYQYKKLIYVPTIEDYKKLIAILRQVKLLCYEYFHIKCILCDEKKPRFSDDGFCSFAWLSVQQGKKRVFYTTTLTQNVNNEAMRLYQYFKAAMK